MKVGNLSMRTVREILQTQLNHDVMRTLSISRSTVCKLRQLTGIASPPYKPMLDPHDEEVCGILHIHKNAEAARRLGVAMATVSRLRRKTGIPSRATWHQPAPRRDAIRSLLQGQRLSSGMIAKHFGINTLTVLKCLRKLEVTGEVQRTGQARATRWQLIDKKRRNVA